MPSDFDPYYFFLGIPPKERPLDHYLLLGVERFEENTQIIEMAADRQMGHLQRYESGEHGDKVAKLLSEVSRARLCLLDANKKSEYNTQLRAKLDPPKPTPERQDAAVQVKPPPPLPRRTAGPNSTSAPVRATLVPSAEPPIEQPTPVPNPRPRTVVASRPAPPVVRPSRVPPAASREILTNSIGMKFVLLPSGQFVMGSPITEPERGNNEYMHPVTIGLPFLLSVHPVTQAQYQQVMGANPSSFSITGINRAEVAGMDTRDFPVEWVSWMDAVEFCRRLSGMPQEHSAGRLYRLPSEAEWEYTCRASTPAVFAFGDSLTSIQANFNGAMPYNTTVRGPNLRRPSAIGSYSPNAWGLCDMHGNVWEWCNDLFSPKHERPIATATKRVLRGGSWNAGARACRSASRLGEAPEQRNGQIGFRVAVQVR